MPRVSQEHLDARRRQILEAARRCFLRDGFHATSMQDVFAEADLSAGAVYRYFKSKDDIVAAIAADALAQLSNALKAAFDPTAPPPLDEVLDVLFGTVEQLDATMGLPRLAVQVWGEAVRSPDLGDRVAEAIGDVRQMFADLVQAYEREGILPHDVPTEQLARVVTALVAGFIMQLAVLRDVDAPMFRAGLRALLTASYEGHGQ